MTLVDKDDEFISISPYKKCIEHNLFFCTFAVKNEEIHMLNFTNRQIIISSLHYLIGRIAYAKIIIMQI